MIMNNYCQHCWRSRAKIILTILPRTTLCNASRRCSVWINLLYFHIIAINTLFINESRLDDADHIQLTSAIKTKKDINLKIIAK
jgi:hypothetical protein